MNCSKEEQEVSPGKQNVIVRNACPLDSFFFFFAGLGMRVMMMVNVGVYNVDLYKPSTQMP